MDIATAQLDALVELEARHADLIQRLDELDKRVERALAECQGYRSTPPSRPPLAAPANGQTDAASPTTTNSLP